MAEQLRVINFNTYTHKSSIIKSNACASPDTSPQPYLNAVAAELRRFDAMPISSKGQATKLLKTPARHLLSTMK